MSPTDRGTAVAYDVTHDEIELHVMLEGGPPYVLTEAEALALSNDLYLVAAARDRAKKASRDAEIADRPQRCGYDRCVLPPGHAGPHEQPQPDSYHLCDSTLEYRDGLLHCDQPIGHQGEHAAHLSEATHTWQ